MTETQTYKRVIRAFMRANYTDERLAQLLAHAQDGKLSYNSCCCLIGVATADHALKETIFTDPERYNYQSLIGTNATHYKEALLLPMAFFAEDSFRKLSQKWRYEKDSDLDESRRCILIPMIRAEIRRRERLVKVKPEVMIETKSCVSA